VIVRPLTCGCLFRLLLMVVLFTWIIALMGAVILVAASISGVLPMGLDDPVQAAERAVAEQMLDGDLSGAHLSVTSITVTPAKAPGHATVTIDVASSVALPADAKPLAAETMVAATSHMTMPFGIAAQTVDSVTVRVFGPGATKPSLTTTVPMVALDDYVSGKTTKAVFISKMTVK
jgi:hypothetical protein